MRSLLDVSDKELRAWLDNHGHPPFRSKQIQRWLYQTRAQTFDEMTDLPLQLRQQLSEDFQLIGSVVSTHRKASDGTEKLVVQLAGGGSVECVLLRDGSRRSICISSQVGCAMGCVFCASGLDGVDRNLTTAEIVEQMLLLSRLLPEEERLSHVVVMGMGEPLANLDRLLPALELASRGDGLGISPRRMTISTVGIPQAIHRLAEQECRYNLAVSLHAPSDELRTKIVPVNRSTGLQEVLAAADRYFEASGRRLTYEYVLLGGINDQPHHARQLSTLLRGRPALLNIIPYNPVPGLPYHTPSVNSQRQFEEILTQAGLNVQFRTRKGDAIDAACGQLRRQLESPPNPEQTTLRLSQRNSAGAVQ